MAALALTPATASGQGVDLTCQFALTRLDHTTTNVLALDTNAVYWSTQYAAVPGTRIRIEGYYPHARYFSWNVYDPAGRPIGDVRMTHKLFEDPTRIAGVREYQYGDPLSRVHWKATARHGRMVSREDTWERSARLVILLDCARTMASTASGAGWTSPWRWSATRS